MSKEEESLNDNLFVIRLRELLEQNKCKEAAQHLKDDVQQGSVSNCLWEIVPTIVDHLRASNKTQNPACCVKLLDHVVENGNSKETILLLLQCLEDPHNEDVFRLLLKPLSKCVVRIGHARVIDWFIGGIKEYIKRLPVPENEKPIKAAEEIEDKALIERLILDYNAILAALKPLVELSTLSSQALDMKTFNYTLSMHISLFGNPFCYLAILSKNGKIDDSTQIFETTLKQMALLTRDFFKYYAIIEDKSRRRKMEMAEDEANEQNTVQVLRRETNVSLLAWANYYYNVLNTDEVMKNVPQVYNYCYLMQGLFYLANFMLNQVEYVLVRKGLKLVESVLCRIDEYSLGSETLESSIHNDLFASLTRVMIYCDSDVDRKLSLKIFHDYIDRFTYRARYLVLTNLYETANHSGLYSLLTSITKTSIIHCLHSKPKLNDFLGTKLDRLMKRICRLPNGACSDLVEISDETIAALNLIRYLVIRDHDDSTGIWDMIGDLKTNYLEPLREGVELSRAHWRMKVADLEKEGNTGSCEIKENKEQEIVISVGGQELPAMPIVEKIKFCHQAICALDVIESILIRVNECIKQHKKT